MNTIHSTDGMVVREMCRRCNYDREKLQHTLNLIVQSRQFQNAHRVVFNCTPEIETLATQSGFYSLVAVEHINEDSVYEFSEEYLLCIQELIVECMRHKSFPVVTIHDEFKAHPNNVNILRQTYIDIMAEIAESTMLEFILSAIQKTPIQIEKYSKDLGDLIRESEYALS